VGFTQVRFFLTVSDSDLLKDFLDFMLSFARAEDSLLKDFVVEFDKFFAAVEQLKINTPSVSFQNQGISKKTVKYFVEKIGLDLNKIESPEKYFQSLNEIVHVNLPLEITLQDVLRIPEKGLQICLNEVHFLLRENKNSQAKELLRLMIVIAPDYPHLWILQGLLEMKDQKWNESKLSILLGLIHSPYSLYAIIPLIGLTKIHDPKNHKKLLEWFIQYKNRLVIDFDTPGFFKKAVTELKFPTEEELYSCLPKGLGNRYNYQVQSQEFSDLIKTGFPEDLTVDLKECFEEKLETLSPSTTDPILRFFLKIIQKSPSEIDRTISKQNLYLHSLALASKGFFLGLKILRLGLFDEKKDKDFTKDVLDGSLILSLLFTLLILVEQKGELDPKMGENFEKIVFFMVNSLPLSAATRSTSLVDALIVDIVERI
jgi:hypothetical protein